MCASLCLLHAASLAFVCSEAGPAKPAVCACSTTGRQARACVTLLPCAAVPEKALASEDFPLSPPLSGFNVRKLEELVAQGRVHARFRRPEPFRRLTATLLARLLTEDSEVDFQLLDLRTPDEFQGCRITQGACCILTAPTAHMHQQLTTRPTSTARSYPTALLRRAHTPFDAAFVAYANREHDLRRILVLYDEDERLAVPAAQLCSEKGVDNVFVLTGGLHSFGGHFPDLIEGVPHTQLAAAFARAGNKPIARSRASVATLDRSRRSRIGGGTPSRAGVRISTPARMSDHPF